MGKIQGEERERKSKRRGEEGEKGIGERGEDKERKGGKPVKISLSVTDFFGGPTSVTPLV